LSDSHWIDPERIFDSIVVMTDDAVYFCNPSEDRSKEISAGLDAGSPASQIVSNEDPTSILIGGIEKVRYDRNDDDIDIDDRLGRNDESRHISLSTAEERDAFAVQLAERLTDFESDTVEWGPVRAAVHLVNRIKTPPIWTTLTPRG
jgi:hypothetical protein